MYVCGATVQGAPHLGHLRSAVVFDQLRRWLTYTGYEVTLVRNVTDIDDKILEKAAQTGVPWWAHAYFYEQEFTRAYDAIGVWSPSYEPRATGHITEMTELISRLIEAEHAYPAEDDSGDVYFATASWPDYGSLTHQHRDDMAAATDAPARAKRDPRDFALWKGHKRTDPATASWPTPWGRGRPGWHIECSAMATKYLGDSFDIHGGGLDLRFPHHENERAQSMAAGQGFAATWMHSGMVTIGTEKMSKSLGNSVYAHALFERVPSLTVRYFLSTAHYRSVLEFSDDAVAAQSAGYERISNFCHRARAALHEVGAHPAPPATAAEDWAQQPAVSEDFRAAMDDDLNTPKALAALFGEVRAGYKLLESATHDEEQRRELRICLGSVETMLDVLGLLPASADSAGNAGAVAQTGVQTPPHMRALDVLVTQLLEDRAAAKRDKDYARADAIREHLSDAGIAVADTPGGGYTYELPS